jgi:predicted DCC family thiol-disulfide oxidoreductase YuxK
MDYSNGKMIILFDGVCNLCNGAVQFVIKRDKRNRFLFAALQSKEGEQLVRERGIDISKEDSIILIEPGIAWYTESEAALKIGQEFGGLWKLLGLFEWIPATFRDVIYRWIARNRYKWFGKKDECMIPTPELKARFISETPSAGS